MIQRNDNKLMGKMDTKKHNSASEYGCRMTPSSSGIVIALQQGKPYKIATARLILLVLGIVCFETMYAQKEDPSKIKAVDITSNFKPVLREAAKINFNATPPSADTVKPKLQ